MQTLKRSILFLVALTFALAATGCGPSAEEIYFTNLTPAIEEYNAAMNEVAEQFGAADSSSLEDPDWMDGTFAALDRLDAAGQVLASTPADEVPEQWADLDNTLVQISEETTSFTTSMKAALEAGDKDAMLEALTGLDTVVQLFEQIKVELSAAVP
ncbi:MAG: hypothetical protein AB1846_02225 [Chloroflexota bacterium]